MTSPQRQSDPARFSRDALLAELKSAGAVVKGGSIKCPFHDDRNPSGGVYDDDNGVWRYKCQTTSCGFCGDMFDVRARAKGKALADVLKANSGPLPFPGVKQRARRFDSLADMRVTLQPDELYVYTNPTTGIADMVVVRFNATPTEAKKFKQASPDGDGFALEAPPKPWPIYGRSRIANADSVFVAEGEKTVHAIAAKGYTATTSPGGAGKAEHADWSPLAGKTVYLWPDNDDAGRKHMKQVAMQLERLTPAPTVLTIDPDCIGMGEKEDAADFTGDLADAIATAESAGPSSGVWTILSDTISGKRRNLPWHSQWGNLQRLAFALLPGTITLFCGEAGSTKSFAMLQAARHWHSQGIPCAVNELEEDREFHLVRAAAQMAGESNLLNDEWVRSNATKVEQIFSRYRQQLDDFGRVLHTPSDEQCTLPDIADWCRDQAKTGKRIIAVDPISVANKSERSWNDDQKFVNATKAIAKDYGASIVLVTHPIKKRGQRPSASDMAGGAAYERLTQSALWLQGVEPASTLVKPNGINGTSDYRKINRRIVILKARNGRGTGAKIGYYFDGAKVEMAEQGVIA